MSEKITKSTKKLKVPGLTNGVVVGVDGDKVWASISQRISTGKYESVELSMGASRTIGSGEITRECLRELAAEVRAEERDLLEILREEEGV